VRDLDGAEPLTAVVSSAVASLRPARARRIPWVPAAIVGVALLVGLAVGDPSPERWILLGAIVAAVAFYAGARWPFTSMLAMIASTILLVIVRVIGLRSMNLIDILMAPVLLASLLGGLHRSAGTELAQGLGRQPLGLAVRRLTRIVIVFYVLAVLSLARLATLAGIGPALDSGLVMIRHLQGIVFYPLCLWWLSTRERIDRAFLAILVAGAGLAIVNIVGVAAWGVKRAGMALFLNNWDAPLTTPNEAGTATLIVGVVLIIRQAMRPHWTNLAVGLLMILLLGLTQSRSGILAWGTFALFTLRWIPLTRLVVGAAGIAAVLPFLPEPFWIRMGRSMAIEPGTNEAYSMFFRFFAWRTAWGVVQDHPLIGIGYLGFRFLSHAYNQFRVVIITVENYYYEVLVSMGVVGLAVLAVAIVRLYQVGREVGRVAPRGSLAYYMARFHAPLVTGLLVANLTGDNFMGMVGLGQLAVWTAVLVRSGHAAIRESAAT
jgi:hypothetical protein